MSSNWVTRHLSRHIDQFFVDNFFSVFVPFSVAISFVATTPKKLERSVVPKEDSFSMGKKIIYKSSIYAGLKYKLL